MSSRRLYLVRHASAGDRDKWAGDDDLRPLDKKGRRQAAGLVEQLAGSSGPVISSPSVRCVQTVEPLAIARGMEIETTTDLAEGTGLKVLDVMRAAPDGAALCTHGDVLFDLLGVLHRQGVVPGSAQAQKGSTWVLGLDGDRVVEAGYLPPPA